VKVGSAGRQIAFIVKKKDEEWWPRLTKDKTRLVNVQVDWSRWKEEDDEEEGMSRIFVLLVRVGC
jgi:prostaglandin-E synthase